MHCRLTSKFPCGYYGNSQHHQHHRHHDGSLVKTTTLLKSHLAAKIESISLLQWRNCSICHVKIKVALTVKCFVPLCFLVADSLFNSPRQIPCTICVYFYYPVDKIQSVWVDKNVDRINFNFSYYCAVVQVPISTNRVNVVCMYSGFKKYELFPTLSCCRFNFKWIKPFLILASGLCCTERWTVTPVSGHVHCGAGFRQGLLHILLHLSFYQFWPEF